MVSIFDQSPNRRCFDFCSGSSEDDFKYGLFMQRQNINQTNDISAEDQRKKKEIDDMLADAMNELTFEERQRQQEVLHGVEDKIIEDPAFINNALWELDGHLKLIKQGSAYEMAERVDPA
mmetsp:Transcript_38264/g.92574  ORF Transcript_38264/g.92574 Transcript_38264/m.92574 type:complete len:120 (-) Transcript_38264:1753-2112(-)